MNIFSMPSHLIVATSLRFSAAGFLCRRGRETVGLLLGLAVAVGLVTSCLTAGIPTLMPQLFSSDPALFPILRSIAPQVSALPFPLSAERHLALGHN